MELEIFLSLTWSQKEENHCELWIIDVRTSSVKEQKGAPFPVFTSHQTGIFFLLEDTVGWIELFGLSRQRIGAGYWVEPLTRNKRIQVSRGFIIKILETLWTTSIRLFPT